MKPLRERKIYIEKCYVCHFISNQYLYLIQLKLSSIIHKR